MKNIITLKKTLNIVIYITLIFNLIACDYSGELNALKNQNDYLKKQLDSIDSKLPKFVYDSNCILFKYNTDICILNNDTPEIVYTKLQKSKIFEHRLPLTDEDDLYNVSFKIKIKNINRKNIIYVKLREKRSLFIDLKILDEMVSQYMYNIDTFILPQEEFNLSINNTMSRNNLRIDYNFTTSRNGGYGTDKNQISPYVELFIIQRTTYDDKLHFFIKNPTSSRLDFQYITSSELETISFPIKTKIIL